MGDRGLIMNHELAAKLCTLDLLCGLPGATRRDGKWNLGLVCCSQPDTIWVPAWGMAEELQVGEVSGPSRFLSPEESAEFGEQH